MTTETILALDDNQLSKWHVTASGKIVLINQPIIKTERIPMKVKVKNFFKGFFSLDGFNAYNF